MKPRVAIDVDGVLGDFITPFFDWHNKQYGTSYTYYDVTHHEFSTFMPVSREEILERFSKFFDHHLHDVKPIPGSHEALLVLKERHDLFVITSRFEQHKEETRKWLETHFPGMFEDLHITGNSTKVAICQEIGAIAMVEDQPNNIELFKGTPIRVIMLDNPCNKNYPYDPRAMTWQDVMRHFD